MEHFSTSRLTAEKLHEGRLADLVALHLDPDVSRYLGGVGSPEETEAYLIVNIAHWEQPPRLEYLAQRGTILRAGD
jgi:hypothetical protein